MLSLHFHHDGAPADELGPSHLDVPVTEIPWEPLSLPGTVGVGGCAASGTAIAFHAACKAGQSAELIALVFPEFRPAAETSQDLALAHPETAAAAHDDLTLVRGIDPAAAAILHSFGVTSFADIAAFVPEDVEIVGRALHDPRRISKEGWIEQCALLAAGTMTAFANGMLSGGRSTASTAPVTAGDSVRTTDDAAELHIATSIETAVETALLVAPVVEAAADPVAQEASEVAVEIDTEEAPQSEGDASIEASAAYEMDALDDRLVLAAEATVLPAGPDAASVTMTADPAPVTRPKTDGAVADKPTLDLESAARSAMACEEPADPAATAAASGATGSNVISLADYRSPARRSARRLRVAAAAALLALGAAGTYGLQASGYMPPTANNGCSGTVFALASNCELLTSIGY